MENEKTSLLLDTLKKANDEAVNSPYWLVIDPEIILKMVVSAKHADIPDAEAVSDAIAAAAVGPFFCKEDAQAYIDGRSYAHSEDVKVCCMTGFRSVKYKEFYEEIKKG